MVGYSPRGPKGPDTTEWLNNHAHHHQAPQRQKETGSRQVTPKASEMIQDTREKINTLNILVSFKLSILVYVKLMY